MPTAGHWTYFSFLPVNIITGQHYSSSLHCCFFSIILDHKTRLYVQRTAWSGLLSWIPALKLSHMHIIAVSEIISWFHAPCEGVLLYKVQTEFRQSWIICAEMRDEGIVFFYFLLPKKKTKKKKQMKRKEERTADMLYHLWARPQCRAAIQQYMRKTIQEMNPEQYWERRTSPTHSSIIRHNKRH